MPVDNIASIVAWYARIRPDFTDIDLLMNARRKLSTRLFELAMQVQALNREFSGAKYRLEIFEMRRFQELRAEAQGRFIATHAEAQVKCESAELQEQEMQAETALQSAKIIYSSGMNVCDVMSQHISNLKMEKQSEMKHSN